MVGKWHSLPQDIRPGAERPSSISSAHLSMQVSRANRRVAGFTLTEAVITLAVMSILGGFGVNSFNNYVQRARAADAVEELDHYRTRMEKGFQDNGNYGVGNCATTVPNNVDKFAFSCALSNNGQSFTARASGTGNLNGYVYSINENGLRRTEALPGLAAATDCWMVQKGKCQ